jgi:predicted transcriptional regulator
MPETKAEIATFKNIAVAEILEHKYPIEIARQLKCVAETIEAIQSDESFKECIIDALDKEGGKTILNGAKIEKMEAGTKYDYSVCNDSIWNDLEKQVKELSEKKKNRETFLKSLANQVEEVISAQGEILQCPIKTSKTTFKITL